MRMLEKNKEYKFFLKNGRIYTGTLIDEDDIFIKIFDIKGDERVFNKTEISDARRLDGKEGSK